MNWDSARDAVALVRLWHEQDREGIEVILDHADVREVARQLALMLLDRMRERDCDNCITTELATWHEVLLGVEAES